MLLSNLISKICKYNKTVVDDSGGGGGDDDANDMKRNESKAG